MGSKPLGFVSCFVSGLVLSLTSSACSGSKHPEFIEDLPAASEGGAPGNQASAGGAGNAAGTEPGNAGGDVGKTPDPVTTSLGFVEQVIEGGPWDMGYPSLAADSAGRAYVMDRKHVWVVDGDQVDVFLTMQETVDALGLQDYYNFTDIDVGPDDTLYLSLGDVIVSSQAAHSVEFWGDYRGEHQWSHSYEQMGVIDDDSILITEQDGMYLANHEEVQLLYEKDAQGRRFDSDCAAIDLAASKAGRFLYQAGCTGNPLLAGRADGSGIEVLYETNANERRSALDADSFMCVAANPSGGFYAVVENYFGDAKDQGIFLYRLTDEVTSTSGYARVGLSPPLSEAEKSTDETFAFSHCSLAVAGDGSVYLQTVTQLWKISF
jgi:hypothetical protein